MRNEAVNRKEIWTRYDQNPDAWRTYASNVWAQFVADVQERDVSDITIYGERVTMMSGGVWRDVSMPATEDPLLMVHSLVCGVFADRPDLLQQMRAEDAPEIDAAVVIYGRRFRVNVNPGFLGYSASLRPMPLAPPSRQRIGFDDRQGEELLKYLLGLDSGIVLVTGATGSGKSSTLAALLDIKRQAPWTEKSEAQRTKIISLEDPIEYLLPDDSEGAIIKQREIGVDCLSFAAGMRSALREKPNIIFVGEMRDAETIRIALEAAETGHVVFSTLHTYSVQNTIERLLRKLPEADRSEGRLVFGAVMRAIICQRLVRTKDGGRMAWREILTGADPQAGTNIANNQDFELVSVMQRNKDLGMSRFADSFQRIRSKMVQEDIQNAELFLSTIGQGIG